MYDTRVQRRSNISYILQASSARKMCVMVMICCKLDKAGQLGQAKLHQM